MSKPIDITDRRWFIRMLEILPGLLTWLFLLSPIILSLFVPVWVAYFIITFDLLWLIKSMRLSINLIRGYRRLYNAEQINWQHRVDALSDIEGAFKEARQKLNHQRRPSWLAFGPKAIKARRQYQELRNWRDQLRQIQEHPKVILDPKHIRNAVFLATYNEGQEVLEPSIQSLIQTNYPAKNIMLIVAYEERGGAEVERVVKELVKKYAQHFAYAVAVKHPDGMPGEVKGKGANISFAAREFTEHVLKEGMDPESIIVTSLDADNRVSPNYFSELTFVYAIDPNRTHKSFQPVPMFFNNIWDVPAPMRLIATGNSFWVLMETMRPHRLRNFSAHAQSLRTLIDTDYWSVTSIVEDGHQYWRTYFTYDGDHQVVPLFAPVYQDAVLAKGYLRTMKAQYLQLRRWAWGVSDFAYVARQSLKDRRISWSDKLVQLARLFEGHFTWATSPLILTFVAWLPLFLNTRFGDQLLAHQLPIIASRIMTLAMLGLVVTVFISLLSLPPRPPRYRRTRTVGMLFQWLLLPIVAIVFSSFASIDAQTRLMLGKYMDFRVTEKVRVKS